MFGFNTSATRQRDEAEKPFWISFADLMTALMVLFLVVMSVALLAVTKRVSDEELRRVERNREIFALLNRVSNAAEKYDGVTIDFSRNVIDFGDKARFALSSHALSDEQGKLLRRFVPDILEIATSPVGQKWLKRIIVEGFTDQSGPYLYNLDLSLKRSQRVLCVLLAAQSPDERVITPSERDQIREMFSVGGFSSNSLRASAEASRRIELRLEFLGLDELKAMNNTNIRSDFGRCAI